MEAILISLCSLEKLILKNHTFLKFKQNTINSQSQLGDQHQKFKLIFMFLWSRTQYKICQPLYLAFMFIHSHMLLLRNVYLVYWNLIRIHFIFWKNNHITWGKFWNNVCRSLTLLEMLKILMVKLVTAKRVGWQSWQYKYLE